MKHTTRKKSPGRKPTKHYSVPLPSDLKGKDSFAALADHVLAILEHPLTPIALSDAVAEFVCNGVQAKDVDGETLLDRWTRQPETVAHILRWSLDQQHREDDEAMAAQRYEGKAVQHG